MMSEANPRGSIRRSRAILRAAFKTLRNNPRLAWFPVLSALGVLVLVIVGGAIFEMGRLVAGESVADLGPLWAVVGDPNPDGDTTVTRAMSIGGIVFYLGNSLAMVAMGVAMTHAALEALAGREWTVRESLRVASRRRRSIATFAIVDATVGRLLSMGARRGRRGRRRSPGPLSRLARFAWWAATYLVLPVIAREGRGGLRAIERSARLLRETWKETMVARLTLGWLWIPAVIVGAVPVVVCAVLGLREPGILMIAVLLPLLGLGVFGLLLHTLEKIYRAALYSYATEGVIPDAFAGDDLHEIWEVRSEPADGGEPSDGGEAIDDSESNEEGEPLGGGEPSDGGEPIDGGEPTDGGEPSDGGEPRGHGEPNDGRVDAPSDD